ncbi:dermatopontin-like [Branchiostoma floridae x Branchiostoma japonicum]
MARNPATAVFVLCVVLPLHFPERARGDSGSGLSVSQWGQSRVAGSWVNGYHDWFSFTCEYWNQFMSGLFSRHDNGQEDRLFKIECRDLTITPEQYGFDFSSGWVNGFDNEFDFECPSHSVMRGLRSDFSSHHKDRVYSFKCMKVVGFCWSGCTWSTYNDYDHDVNIPTEDWRFITGARSHHDDSFEDRQFSFQRCGVKPCYPGQDD